MNTRHNIHCNSSWLIAMMVVCLTTFTYTTYAQTTKKTTTTTKKATTTTAKKATTTTKKAATTTSKKATTTTSKKAAATKAPAKQVDKKTQLKNEQVATQRQRQQSQQQIQTINKNIKDNLDNVLILENRISRQQRQIDSLAREMKAMTVRIDTLNSQIARLKRELLDKKKKYANAMVYLQQHKSVQEKLMFVFSADNLSQIIRRMRYIKEYSSYQKAQGEMIKQEQAEMKQKQEELMTIKARMEANLAEMRRKEQALEANKKNCETRVAYLNKNLSTVQNQIKQLQKREADLNAQIDRIIQQEIEEARRKAAEEKARKEAEARRAEQLRIEKERKLAEAKAAEERARKEKELAEAARKAATTEAAKAAAKAESEKASANIKAAEKETKAAEKEVKAAVKAEKEEAKKQPATAVTAYQTSAANAAKLTTAFASNKGKLPIPISGSYTIVGHYGTYTVAGLKNVTLENKGIDIRGTAGCQARSVFEGEVSSVFQYGGSYTIMIRHGSYISVYSGLSSVSVASGNKVTQNQLLGKVGADADGHYTLQFQLRKESARLNPEQWVK